jgi:diaminopimelate decarboxylase
VAEEGLGCDVAGAGELVHALAAGVDPQRIYLHGNAKTDEDLRRAIEAGVGTVVVDNLDDVARLERLVADEQGVLVRVIPGVRPDTHAAVATGQEDSKFGLAPADARRAIERVRGSDRLRLDGLHVHIGSQILDAAPFGQAVAAIAAFGAFAVYDLGGGLGARYTYAEWPPSVAEYLDVLVGAAREHLPAQARLVIEPGRSVVARAGVTIYRVVTVKRGARTFVAVDGGMGDNLEVSLYGQRFEATVADRVGGGETVDLVGRHCESGDVLSAGVALRDPRVGDVVAVPATGAYCFTMRNGYNGALRPPLVFVRDGDARVVVRRERYEDLLRLDA